MKIVFNNSLRFILMLSIVTTVACSNSSEKEPATTQEETSMKADTAMTSANEAKMNVNTASEEELLTIPNVGDKMAHEFEEYRPYVSIRQFRKEIGKYVDEEQVSAYEKYLYVPIDRNESDAATLMQIPGLEQAEADKLAAARPFENDQAFIDSLSSYVSEEQLDTARSYLKAE